MEQSDDTKLQLLVTIVDYSLGSKLRDAISREGTPLQLLTHGYGLADSQMYDILGFGSPKKLVSFSIHKSKEIPFIMGLLKQDLNLSKPGTGVTFSIEIRNVSKLLVNAAGMAAGSHNICQSEEKAMHCNEPYNLIFTIVNAGHCDKVMEAARKAGATGGTMIHARGLASEEVKKFLAITIQPEKDIVLIVAPHEKNHPIMESIAKEVGLGSEAKGICFSLPVNSVIGLIPPEENKG